MTFIVPFQEEFCGKIHTVYYVNNDNQNSFYYSSVTSSKKCPHCGERHIFKVFEHKAEREEDGWGIEVYDGKCPACRKEFDIEIKYEMD